MERSKRRRGRVRVMNGSVARVVRSGLYGMDMVKRIPSRSFDAEGRILGRQGVDELEKAVCITNNLAVPVYPGRTVAQVGGMCDAYIVVCCGRRQTRGGSVQGDASPCGCERRDVEVRGSKIEDGLVGITLSLGAFRKRKMREKRKEGGRIFYGNSFAGTCVKTLGQRTEKSIHIQSL